MEGDSSSLPHFKFSSTDGTLRIRLQLLNCSKHPHLEKTVWGLQAQTSGANHGDSRTDMLPGVLGAARGPCFHLHQPPEPWGMASGMIWSRASG